MINSVVIIFLFGTHCLTVSALLPSAETTYKIGEDYIYRITQNSHDRNLNPQVITIVRNVSLVEITNAIAILKKLNVQLELICKKIGKYENDNKADPQFEIYKGSFNVSTAKTHCEINGKQLMEIQKPEELLTLLQKIGDDKIITPAGASFSSEKKTFLFDSNNKTFSTGPVKLSAFGFEMIPKYIPYIYDKYHLKYILNGSKYTFDYVQEASSKYDKIVCMRKNRKRTNSLSKTCFLDYESASAMINNTDSIVKAYFASIYSQMENRTVSPRRYPRGLFTVAAIGALSGGVLFGVIPDLFRNSLSEGDLKAKSQNTELLLGDISSRLNMLDSNQIKLAALLDQRIENSQIEKLRDNTQEIRIRMNTIHIFLTQRLNFLQKLTGLPTSARSYLLSISVPEIVNLVTKLHRNVRANDITDENILYSFQSTTEGKLYMILRLLLPNKVRIRSFVKATAWPRITNNSLVVRDGAGSKTFIYLTGSNYIEIDPLWIHRCLNSAELCFTEKIPRRIISGEASAVVSQYFDMNESEHEIRFTKIYRRSFLMDIAGSHLAYTTLDPMEAKMECGKEDSKIINLTGKGVLKIKHGCQTSSPFFTMNTPADLGLISLPENDFAQKVSFNGAPLWNTSRKNEGTKLDYTRKKGYTPNRSRKSIIDPLFKMGLIYATIIGFTVVSILCMFIFLWAGNSRRLPQRTQV